MPVYNCEKLIPRAIESILSQDFDDFEMLVIDDGSEDGSGVTARLYEERDTRVKVISPGRLGLVGALNAGLAAASGIYIARMDADDVSLPNRFSKQVEYLNANSACGALGTGTYIIDENGRFMRYGVYPSGSQKLSRLLDEGCFLCHPSVMFRRRLYEDVGGYDPRFLHAEDYEFWVRLSAVCDVDNLDERLLIYTHHTNKISLQHYPQQVMTTLIIGWLKKNGKSFDNEVDEPVHFDLLLDLDITADGHRMLVDEWNQSMVSSLHAGVISRSNFDPLSLKYLRKDA